MLFTAFRPYFFCLCFALSAVGLAVLQSQAQAPDLNVPNPQYVVQNWKARWITHPDLSGAEHAVVLFRRQFALPTKPSRFVVNVTADNHYTLYVNGQRVCFGPQLSDVRHWRYETIDIAPYLQAGDNVIAAEVVNWGYYRFFGMQSVHTGFLLNGFTDAENFLGTSVRGSDWKVFWNKAVHERPVRWRVANPDIIGGFYAVNPTDSLRVAEYPWGWEKTTFDDRTWQVASYLENASAFGGSFGWMLQPRTTPVQMQQQERLTQIARSTGGTVPDGFLKGTQALVIPPNSKRSVLIDHTYLTMGYPELRFSGGNGAQIHITYAENLFLPDKNKGNRNDLTGKRIVGYKDVIVADGSSQRTFRPTWLRTFRFVQVDISTQAESLTLHDFYNVLTVTPIERKAEFSCGNATYEKIQDICWRTVRLCTQDYFLSDAYYETMQYVGDSKVHILSWQSFTGNDLHTRNALEQFDYSRLPDGNLTSCYPLKATFVHPTYSLIWVDMLYDYLLYRGDRAFVQQFLPNIRHTIAGFEALMQPNGLVGPTKWDYFVDWYVEARSGGVAPGNKGVNSAVVTLHYVFTLQNAAKLFDYFGLKDEAARYRQRAEEIRAKVVAQCYDSKRGLFAERPDKSFYDQHTNIMAVLTDALPASQQAELLRKTLSVSEKLSPATYYYRIYLFEALRKTKAGDLFDLAQKPWEDLINDGMTTTLERFEDGQKPTRSECHPWSTAPAYAHFSLVAGITPAEIGFKKVNIEPQLGGLPFVEGQYPHPSGMLRFKMTPTARGGIEAEVSLPEGTTGTFVWKGKSVPLKSGSQQIKL
jgi:alpha-L-rhamnosidase